MKLKLYSIRISERIRLGQLLTEFISQLYSNILPKSLQLWPRKTVILLYFFNPNRAWNFTLREEARLAVFQNNFRDNISIWERLSKRKRKENHRWNILVSNSIRTICKMTESRWTRWEEYVVCTIRNDTCTFLVTKFKLKKLLGKPKCREKDNIKMDLKEPEDMSTDSVQMN